MNPDNVMDFLQTGFRVGVGATASLLESIQDAQKREENLADLKLDVSDLTKKWAEKGELTEREARNFVDTLIDHQRSPSESPSSETPPGPSSEPPSSPPTSAANPEVYQDLQDLTAQIAALRSELENLQQKDSEP
jgi:polyhydroxyalkanoate synthesis regulator phasin